MGNLVSLVALAHDAPLGSEVLLGDESHIYHYEQGGTAAVAGLAFNVVPTGADGTLAVEELAARVRVEDPHYAHSHILALENTHNRRGGRVLPVEYLRDVASFAKEVGLRLHVDGARLANAAAASGLELAALGALCDTVTMCLSKGLGAPVGSVVAGEHAVIARARRARKLLGGGMRQAGVIAGAGLHALQHRDHLPRDHANAKSLAYALAALPAVELDVSGVESNIVYFDIPGLDASEVVARAEAKGVLVGCYGTSRVRLVTHYQVSDEGIMAAADTLRSVITDLAEAR